MVTASYQRYRLVIKLLLGCLSVRAESPLTRLDQIALVQLKDVMMEVASAYDNYDFNKAAQAITRWLDQDFSAFYMNAIKDRLYCDNLQPGVLEEIFYGLLRMLAPITPTLVEEAWSFRPDWMKDPSSPLEEGHNYPFHNSLEEPLSPRAACITSDIRNDIPWLLKANAAIKKAQEKARKAKLIGSSLQSSVILSLRLEACELFNKYNNDPTDGKLAEIFVVSSVDIAEIAIGSSIPLEAPLQGEWSFSSEFDTPGGKGVAWVLPPKEAKCPRCWRYVAPVADELCERCQSVVNPTILEIPNEASAV
jgi:isoleucyl-tRNA synthetase